MNIFHFNKKIFIFLILLLILVFFQSFNKDWQQDPLTKSSYIFFSEIQTVGRNLQKSIANTVKKYLFLLDLRDKKQTTEGTKPKTKSSTPDF